MYNPSYFAPSSYRHAADLHLVEGTPTNYQCKSTSSPSTKLSTKRTTTTPSLDGRTADPPMPTWFIKPTNTHQQKRQPNCYGEQMTWTHPRLAL